MPAAIRSTMSSMSSSRLATWAYSEAEPVPSASATRRVVTAPSPSRSRIPMAVATMRSADSGYRAGRRDLGLCHGGAGIPA
jgi:hypothetical protein